MDASAEQAGGEAQRGMLLRDGYPEDYRGAGDYDSDTRKLMFEGPFSARDWACCTLVLAGPLLILLGTAYALYRVVAWLIQ